MTHPAIHRSHLALFLALATCGPGQRDNPGQPAETPDSPEPAQAAVQVAIASIAASPGAPGRDAATAPTFGTATTFAAGRIDSGPPDYAKLTLKRIELERPTGVDTLWSGSVELTIDGGSVDASLINAQLLPVSEGPITAVRVTFDSRAKVKGTLHGTFNMTSGGPNTGSAQTFFTKTDAAYDPTNASGGASNFSHFATGPSEEMDVTLNGHGPELVVETASTATIGAQGSNTLTLLFDTSRFLRFYNGLNSQGVNPSDPADKAYFFAHSLLGMFTAAFIGAAGRIDGYRTFFSSSPQMGNTTAEGVRGWLTLVYDPSGGFLSGMLIGDDDNALTIAKGRVTAMSPSSSGAFDFEYDIAGGVVTGFVPASTVGHFTSLATFATAQSGQMARSGQAYFELALSH